MTASERRQELIGRLLCRRRDTVPNLAFEFGVSENTIRRDILELTRSYPIETRSSHDGGVFIQEGDQTCSLQFLDDSDRDERGLGLFFAKVLMDRCDEVWVFADGAYSAGMRSEHERAVRKGFKSRYFTTDCRKVHPDRDRREEQMEPFQGLANEIVIQAVKDYRAAGQEAETAPGQSSR